ncbi:MAG: hypothetical protein LAQ69_20190 [Acidobacteriia bacterium]|nr:hypothetical protein [Terriglobia bacterium]
MAKAYAQKKLETVAFHEAGHAVVAAMLGIPFQRVTIRPDAVYAGHVALGPGDPPERVCPWNPDWDVKQARQYWKRHICGLLAGALAETLHTRCWQQQPVDDEHTDESKALEIADYFDPPTKAMQWVNQLRFQTLETLRAPQVWAAVTTVAQELVRAKALDGAAVHALVCNRVRPSHLGTAFDLERGLSYAH